MTPSGASDKIAQALATEPYRAYYAANGIQFAAHCAARGRYEIAAYFQRLGAQWYEDNVVRKPDPDTTKEDREYFREFLQGYKDRIQVFPFLIQIRTTVLAYLAKHPSGIERNKLKEEIGYHGAPSFGVICNQLGKGGWLRQVKQGKIFMLYPAAVAPVTDWQFFDNEGLSPKRLDQRFASVDVPAGNVTLVKASAPVRPAKRAGCLVILAVAATVGSALLVVVYMP